MDVRDAVPDELNFMVLDLHLPHVPVGTASTGSNIRGNYKKHRKELIIKHFNRSIT